MTDRIKELMEETGLYIAYENREITEKELRYFAEAIVQDCLNMCDWETGKRIQKHFEYRDNRWPETELNPRPF